MVRLTTRKFSIDSFFEFAEGSDPFELVDIINDRMQQSGLAFDVAPGEYSYRTHFLLDQTMAKKLGVIGVKLDVFIRDPVNETLQSVDAIKTMEIRFHETKKILETTTGRQQGSWQNDQHEVFVSKQLPAALPAGMILPGRTPPRANTLRHTSKAARGNNRDPAALARSGNFSAATSRAATSRDSTNQRAGNRHEDIRSTSTRIESRESLSATRSVSRRATRSNQDNEVAAALSPPRPTRRAPVACVTLIPAKKEYIRSINIKKDEMQGAERLFVAITAITKSDSRNTFGKKNVEVNHGRELFEFLANPEAPDVSLLGASQSHVSIRIQKDDPTLKNVRIVRIVTNPNMNRTQVTDVSDVSFGKESVIKFDDRVDNIKPNHVVYRVVVINGDGSVGDFSSIVIPSFKKVSDPLNSAGTPVSIRAINTQDRISINVVPLSRDILTLRLLRQELEKTGNFSEGIVTLQSTDNETTTVLNGSKTEIEFHDDTTILGRKYRYFTALRIGQPGDASRSQEIISDEDEVIIRKFFLGELPFAIDVTSDTVETDTNNNISVSFEIVVEATADLFSTVIHSLREAGIADEFISKLQNDETKTKLFTMFLVERFEVATGIRASFGLVPPGKFVDSPKSRLPRGIPSPIAGKRYEYIIKTCLQQPSVFLQSSNIGVINRENKEFSKSAARFGRLIYDKLGILPPESDILNGKSIESLVLESQIGQEQAVRISLPAANPIVEHIDIINKVAYNFLTWRVTGNTAEVSYFLVYCNIDGHEQLLGATAATESASVYRFRDDRFFDEVGEKTYSVKVINFDDDEIMTSPLAKTNRNFSVPENMFDGVVLLTVAGKPKIMNVEPASFYSRQKNGSFIKPLDVDEADSPTIGSLLGEYRTTKIQPKPIPKKYAGGTSQDRPQKYGSLIANINDLTMDGN
jgi:hypothetical protein